MFIKNEKITGVLLKGYKNLKEWYFEKKNFNQLTIGLTNKTGRGSTGKITVYSKGSKKNRTLYKIINMTFIGFSVLNFLVKIQFDTNRNSVVGLFYNCLGCWFYSLLPANFFIFDYIKVFKKNVDSRLKSLTRCWPRYLLDFPLHSKISFLEDSFNKKIKFIRSAGSRGLLLNNEYRGDKAIIVFPSFKVKILDNSNRAFLDFIQNELYRFHRLKNAGPYVNKGRKPTVRGIVKNNCDHPNGGKTRTVCLSRTPWGKVAKKSRKRSVIVHFKTMVRRVTNKQKHSDKSFSNIFQNNNVVRFISKNTMDLVDQKNL